MLYLQHPKTTTTTDYIAGAGCVAKRAKIEKGDQKAEVKKDEKTSGVFN